MVAQKPIRGLVLETFGAGNAPEDEAILSVFRHVWTNLSADVDVKCNLLPRHAQRLAKTSSLSTAHSATRATWRLLTLPELSAQQVILGHTLTPLSYRRSKLLESFRDSI